MKFEFPGPFPGFNPYRIVDRYENWLLSLLNPNANLHRLKCYHSKCTAPHRLFSECSISSFSFQIFFRTINTVIQLSDIVQNPSFSHRIFSDRWQEPIFTEMAKTKFRWRAHGERQVSEYFLWPERLWIDKYATINHRTVGQTIQKKNTINSSCKLTISSGRGGRRWK